MRRGRHRRRLLPLLPACLLLPVPAAAQPPVESRLQAMEAQLRTLMARVEALERRGSGESANADADEDPGALVWTPGEVVAGSPLRITHKELDLDAGRLELLLEVTAPLAAPALWSTPGAEVPLAATLRDAEGSASTHRFRLVRGSSTEPGARLHLSTAVDPARAAAARQLIIDTTAN